MRVLLDLRPAFDGHSGIPQEARLLFRGLAGLPGVKPVGLLQSGNLVLERGFPLGPDGQPVRHDAGAVDLQSRVVVSMLQGPASHKLAWLRKRWLEYAGPMRAALASLAGVHTELSAFDPQHFHDFVWRGMFAKSLPAEDLELVVHQEFRVMRWPWSKVNAVGVATAALGHALYPRLDTRGIDCFIAETPYPGRVRRGTKLVIRYHDAMPVLMPHTVKNRGHHRAIHIEALKRNDRDGAWMACVSESTRQDLLAIAPHLEPRTVVIPNMVSHHFRSQPGPAERIATVLRSHAHSARESRGEATDAFPGAAATPRYLLMVATLEPRKNHLSLLQAWEALRAERSPGLQLVFVGSPGWDNDSIMQRVEPWLKQGGLHLLQGVPADDLRLLYQHAQVTVCPSFAEGFDFSGVEAMASGGVVAASDIPVHREVYGQAATYFNAYSVPDLTRLLADMLSDTEAEVQRRRELIAEGARQAGKYTAEAVMPQWAAFLDRLGPGG